MLHTEGCDLSDAEHSGRLISCYSMVNFCEQFLTMAEGVMFAYGQSMKKIPLKQIMNE